MVEQQRQQWQQQAGVALLTALLLIAMATVVGGEMLKEQWFMLRYHSSQALLTRARLLADGGERLAAVVLARDQRNSKYDHLDEDWALVLPPLPVDGGYIGGLQEDLQGRFNLNNLLTEKGQPDALQQARFTRLLKLLEADEALVHAVLDWIDADSDVRIGKGAEDDYYSTLEPPYLAANGPLVSISELRLVHGFEDAKLRQRLADHITVLPRGEGININTASDFVFRSIAPHISSVSDFENSDEERRFTSVNSFVKHKKHNKKTIKKEGLTVSSRYFLAQVHIELEDVQLQLHSILQRDKSKGKVVVLRRFWQE